MSAWLICHSSRHSRCVSGPASIRAPALAEGLSARERGQTLVLRNRGVASGNPSIHWVFLKHLLCASLSSGPWGSALVRNSSRALPCAVHGSSTDVPGKGLEMQSLRPRPPFSKAPSPLGAQSNRGASLQKQKEGTGRRTHGAPSEERPAGRLPLGQPEWLSWGITGPGCPEPHSGSATTALMEWPGDEALSPREESRNTPHPNPQNL